VRDGREVLVDLIASQEELHAGYGGVVPEVAARAHLERLPGLIDAAFAAAGLQPAEVGKIAVTRGPGLVGCLLVGTGLARGLADAWDKPLHGVNHLWGHIYAALLTNPDLEPPLLALVVSGAHTDLVSMPRHGVFEVLGRTRDDAAGEAFDKAARILGLGYPGGPAIDRLARAGDARRQALPVPELPDLEFSYSGLKTALLYRVRDLGGAEALEPEQRADLAAAFQESIVASLLGKLGEAMRRRPSREVVVCGGVAANSLLRSRAAELTEGSGARLTIPSLELCTDNAAMVAAASHFVPSAELSVDPNLPW
jgi:tRNA N6-adenosine threonylcarbamoyltransferase